MGTRGLLARSCGKGGSMTVYYWLLEGTPRGGRKDGQCHLVHPTLVPCPSHCSVHFRLAYSATHISVPQSHRGTAPYTDDIAKHHTNSATNE
jgi:hypothetical protein